jgi:hypothetical protein
MDAAVSYALAGFFLRKNPILKIRNDASFEDRLRAFRLRQDAAVTLL